MGGNAQVKAMRSVAGSLRLDLAQYRELAAFAQFGSDLDEATVRQLTRGKVSEEILKQGQYIPMPMEKQVMILWMAGKGYVDDIPVDKVKSFEDDYHQFMEKEFPDVAHEIKTKKDIDEALNEKLKQAADKFRVEFKAKL